jgi:hypothetical protein
MECLESDIPAEAVEEFVSPYKQEGNHLSWRTMNCILNGGVVGQRQYDDEGILIQETPLKNGRKHGREYTWWDGQLLSMEPYFEGKIHGVAEQYGHKEQVIGTYRFVHGTGFDIWRDESLVGRVTISEIHSMRDGVMQGYEWWVNANQSSVWHERHWHEGTRHGIERMWNQQGRLRRGYPKYWIRGEAVVKRQYLRAARQDPTLPSFREQDNLPQRNFPPEIEESAGST